MRVEPGIRCARSLRFRNDCELTQQRVDERSAAQSQQRVNDSGELRRAGFITQPDHDVRSQHAARKEVDNRRQLVRLVEQGCVAGDGQPAAVRQRGDGEHGEDDERFAPEKPTNDREDDVELDLDAEGPKRSADGAERVLPPRVYKEGVDDIVARQIGPGRKRRAIEQRERREREEVRWQDLQRATPCEVGHGRHSAAFKQMPSVWVKEAEAADEKEEVDADKSSLRNRSKADRVAENAEGLRLATYQVRVVPENR